MMDSGVHYTSAADDWATPQKIYNELDDEFNFTLDVCASDWNAKHPNYFTKEDDALIQDWSSQRAFMNPPYGSQISKFVEKASTSGAELVVAILPARTDTRWFWDFVLEKAEIRFIKGRLKFERPDGPQGTAPFPSIIAIWRNPPKQELLI